MKNIAIMAGLVIAGMATMYFGMPRLSALKAERQYDMVGMSDKCRAARRVADAWLAAEDSKKFEHWDMMADMDCMRAALSS